MAAQSDQSEGSPSGSARRLVRAAAISYNRGVRAPVAIVALVVTASLALGLAACAGGRGQLRGSLYESAHARYQIGPLGADWRRLDVADENDLAWHSERAAAVIQVNSTCDPDSDIPLVALTNHLLGGFTDREILSEERVPLDGREALRTHVTARLDGVPRELLLYVMKKDDCVYDLALLSPGGASFEGAASEFEPFVRGFTTEVHGR